MSYQVKDSGERVDYPTGAKRDTDKGKPRYDLVSAHALHRLAMHLMRGAEKYGDRNWEKGIPTDRLMASAMRHLYAHQMGLNDEDHLAAVVFNIMAIMHFQELGGNPADGGAACGTTTMKSANSNSGTGNCCSECPCGCGGQTECTAAWSPRTLAEIRETGERVTHYDRTVVGPFYNRAVLANGIFFYVDDQSRVYKTPYPSATIADKDKPDNCSNWTECSPFL